MYEHAAHQLLRDGDCNEDIEKIKSHLMQVEELAGNEKERISTGQSAGENKSEPERNEEPGTEDPQTRTVEKVLGREHLSTLTSLEVPITQRDSLLEAQKEETSVDDPSRSVVGITRYMSTSKDSVPHDEGSTGEIFPSTSSAGSLSEISVGSTFNAGEADMNIDTFNPERKETDIKYWRRVEGFADPETWLARLERMRNEVMSTKLRISLILMCHSDNFDIRA
ncbi:hypothetical protein F5B21DRAFT_491704 [Xylaria acuta]|nr:hypothetical protein F5B21DRAFT_491704 [Xylaria acuta]